MVLSLLCGVVKPTLHLGVESPELQATSSCSLLHHRPPLGGRISVKQFPARSPRCCCYTGCKERIRVAASPGLCDFTEVTAAKELPALPRRSLVRLAVLQPGRQAVSLQGVLLVIAARETRKSWMPAVHRAKKRSSKEEPIPGDCSGNHPTVKGTVLPEQIKATLAIPDPCQCYKSLIFDFPANSGPLQPCRGHQREACNISSTPNPSFATNVELRRRNLTMKHSTRAGNWWKGLT